MSTTLGIDVSNNNGGIDWPLVHSAYRFAWAKIAGGPGDLTGGDRYWPANHRQARAAKVRIGGYYFARPGNETADEAVRRTLVYLHPLDGDLVPALDLEVSDRLSHRQAWIWGFRYCTLLHRELGKRFREPCRPIIYTYPDFMHHGGIGEGLEAFPLWLAAVGANGNTTNRWPDPSPWPKSMLAVHQNGWNARVPGVAGACDVDRLAPAWTLDKLTLRAK